MRLGGRGLSGAVAGLIVSATLASADGAGAATSIEAFQPDHGVLGGIFLRGDALGSTVRIGADATFGEYVLRDTRRPLKLRPGDASAPPCRLVNRHLARCAVPARRLRDSSVTVRLRGGADQLFPQRSLVSPIAVNGGTGIDEINAAAGDDVLVGGPGGDILRGLDGDDNLTGGADDELNGGDGDDVILADFGDRERLIDCGPGEDRAFVDSDDVETFDCETVEEG